MRNNRGFVLLTQLPFIKKSRSANGPGTVFQQIMDLKTGLVFSRSISFDGKYTRTGIKIEVTRKLYPNGYKNRRLQIHQFYHPLYNYSPGEPSYYSAITPLPAISSQI